MLRLSLLVSLGAAMVAVVVLWLVVGGTPPLEARYALENCRRVGLRDVDTGKMLAGVSDMLLLPDGDTLVLSAYDRSDQTRPFGGLFAVSLLDLARGDAELEVEALIKPFQLAGGVYPEGITRDGSGRIALINDVGAGEGTVIDVIEKRDGIYVPVERHAHEAFCRLNDLAFDFGGNLHVTRGRAACKLNVIDALPFYATGIALIVTPDGRVAAGEERRFFLPNGIVMGPTDQPIIAEMRAERLTGEFERQMPGGPDNLTVDDDGGIVAAVHPSLWKMFLYVNGFAFSSPSRVVRYDPGPGDLEILLDDPGGDLLSAVGVGLLEEGRLYLGSVVDEGIGICTPS